MTIERGIIANPGIVRRLPGGFRLERSISAEELYYYILYWQRIVIPGNNLVYIGVPNEEELISCGAISRPRVQFQGSFQGDMVTDALLACQNIVASDLTQDKTIDWVIHQVGDDVAIKLEDASFQDQIRFDLANALPVPIAETPLHEILEFKERRKIELMELHVLLDELYMSILRSPDPELARRIETSRLVSSIANIERITAEKFKKTRKYDLSTSINLNFERIATGAAVGAMFGWLDSGLTLSLGVAGALASLVKVEAKASYSIEAAKDNLKLSYLSHASKAGFLVEPSR